MKSAVEKRDRVAHFIHHCESMAEAAKAEQKRLAARAKAFDTAAERMKAYVLGAMKSLQLKKLEGNSFTFSTRACPDSVLIADEALVPERFKTIRMEVSISKAEIKKAIQAGETVEGADLKIGGLSLVIR